MENTNIMHVDHNSGMKNINQELSGKMSGQQVTHTVFGKGTVTFCSNVAITVQFADRTVSFLFPYAFKQFLTAEDPDLQQEIISFYDTGAWLNPIHDHGCPD